ncbi:hypothetical protein KIW84_060509 [Lathyrus oleraceus]|uniref:Uncharacterized protein n=1 Tax=Pisum sativum TaxID=3888 RepID=A0A9D4W0C2_PEA|nr:hypothetical protein KIW84_060509 [Pisum sativum]
MRVFTTTAQTMMDDESPPAKAGTQAKDPNGVKRHSSSQLRGFFLIFHRVARKSYSTLERIVIDGEIRKRKYSPIAKKRRTWAMTSRSLSG